MEINMITSKVRELGKIEIPLIIGEYSMIPFNLKTLEGLNKEFKSLAIDLLKNLKTENEIGFFTIHGKVLKKGETLRRGGPHTDGSYDRNIFDWDNNSNGGWKVGENGPDINSNDHKRLYLNENGGIILASNYSACRGWIGNFEGIPDVGGDCSKLLLNIPFKLKSNTIYYGNNHFIHESLPMEDDIHRVFVRITLPETHKYI